MSTYLERLSPRTAKTDANEELEIRVHIDGSVLIVISVYLSTLTPDLLVMIDFHKAWPQLVPLMHYYYIGVSTWETGLKKSFLTCSGQNIFPCSVLEESRRNLEKYSEQR